MEILNNREIATLVWLVAILVYAFRLPNFNNSMKAAIQAVFVTKLNALYVLMLSYVGLMVWLLHEVGIWEPEAGQIKATLMWVFTAGLVAVFRAINMRDRPGYLKQAANAYTSDCCHPNHGKVAT